MLLQPRQRLVDLLLQALGEGVLAHVGHARLGGDREPAPAPGRGRGCASSPRRWRPCLRAGRACPASPRRTRRPIWSPPCRRSYRATACRQPNSCVVLERVGDRPLGLAQRAGVSRRRLGQRPADGVDQEGVRLLGQRERARLAGRAHHAARGAREAAEVLALAARGARGQLRRQAGGEQQLEAEGELVGVAGAVGLASRAARARCTAGCRRRGAARRCRTGARPRRRRGPRCPARRRARAGAGSRRRSRPRSRSAARCGPRAGRD